MSEITQLRDLFETIQTLEEGNPKHDQLFHSLINQLESKLKELKQLGENLHTSDLIKLSDIITEHKYLAVRPDPRAMQD